MRRVIEFLRSLGNAGAIANASGMIAHRRDEERVVDGLSGRVSTANAPRTVAVGRDRVA